LLHGLDGRFGTPGPRDKDNRDVAVDAADLLMDLYPGPIGQFQVEDNDIR
jgi:hypothetical protein